MRRRRITPTVLAIALSIGLLTTATAQEPLRFRVELDPSVADKPVTGRLLVLLSQGAGGEPRFGPNWFSPEPFFACEVEDFQGGEFRDLDDRADGFPTPLAKLPPGKYRVQAVLDHAFDSLHHGRGEGNFFSDVESLELDPDASGTVELRLTNVVPPREPVRRDGLQEIRVRSELLSTFHHREVLQPAAVILPPNYEDEPDRRYPTIYVISGFAGSHTGREWVELTGPREPIEGENVEFIRVMLGGQCKWGHHVYANGPTNGPRGDALVEELIPWIEENFRAVAAPTARFLTGHSSGGWSSLWLQVNYPDTFGGVWSSSPDVVDFRDFQQINLYAVPPLNMYRDEHRGRRPIARRGEKPVLWYDSFCRMDDCMGQGGQLRSLEAVFSPLDSEGLPRRLWDRATGRIDPAVAQAWRKYDIRLLLEENWETLGPKLAGKLHVTIGELDSFYLEGAVQLLAETLQRLGSDAVVEIVPGGDHGTVVSRERALERRRQTAESYLRHHPAGARRGSPDPAETPDRGSPQPGPPAD